MYNKELRNLPHSTSTSTVYHYNIIITDMYPHRFRGIGRFTGKLHIRLNKEIWPVIHATRRVSINLHNEVSAELQRITSKGIIRPIKKPTAWVSSITYARKKSNHIRICLDPKDLNKEIRRPNYTTQTRYNVNYLWIPMNTIY